MYLSLVLVADDSVQNVRAALPSIANEIWAQLRRE